MLVCFGLSWPMNAYKNYKARTAAGASWQFILLITLGYVAGIAAKFASGNLNWVLAVYFVNLACVGVNWAVYLRNRRLDRFGDLRRFRKKIPLFPTGFATDARKNADLGFCRKRDIDTPECVAFDKLGEGD